MSDGKIQTLVDALVTLEQTISLDLEVSKWRPTTISPPHLYNWIQPSPADIPAIGIVRDEVNVSVRIIVPTSTVDEQTAQVASFWDLARDVIDADLIEPSQSVLLASALMARRTTMRNITDVFNDVAYLGLELVIQAELRRRFA